MSQQQASRNLEESNYQQRDYDDVMKAGQTKLQRDNKIDHSVDDQHAQNVAVSDQINGSTDNQSPGEQQLGDVRTDITIGEALEATALTSGARPIDYSDAAAIEAAEVRATGHTYLVPGGIAATAQSAATHNALVTDGGHKLTLGEVLTDASSRLPWDRAVTHRDAQGVIYAELMSNDHRELGGARHGGVAASMAAAARLNQSLNNDSLI